MKKISIPFILFFLTLVCISQENNSRKGIIGVALGPSFPLNDYADNDGENDDAGFAMTGLHLNFNFGYKFTENIGVAALLTGNAHPIDVDEMVDLFWHIDPSLYWELETGSWATRSLMGGLLVILPFEKIDFDIKGLIGYSASTIPNISIKASDGISSIKIKQNKADARSFALNLGAGIRFNLSEKLVLTINRTISQQSLNLR